MFEEGPLMSANLGNTEASTSESPGFPDRRFVEVSRDPTPGVPGHAAAEGAPLHPLIDLSRDPNPGKPDHALPDDED